MNPTGIVHTNTYEFNIQTCVPIRPLKNKLFSDESQSNKIVTESSNEIYYKRFKMLMKLIRIDKMLKNAKIVHVQNPQK